MILRLAIVALLGPFAGCGPHPPDVRSRAAAEPLGQAPSVTTRDGVAVVRAQRDARWGEIVDLLDRVKKSGTTRFVLAAGEREQSSERAFPRVGQLAELPSVVDLADKEHLQHVTEKTVALLAPAAAARPRRIGRVPARGRHRANR